MLQDRFRKQLNNNARNKNKGGSGGSSGSGQDPQQPEIDPSQCISLTNLDPFVETYLQELQTLQNITEVGTGELAVTTLKDVVTGAHGDIKTVASKREQALKAAQDLVGQVIADNYRIDSLLAHGGMGQVFMAYHLGRNIPVVLKLMLGDANPDDPAFARFVQECKVTTRLRHPNLVSVLDWGILFGSLKPYLVMEYVEGESLRRLIKRQKTFSPFDAAKLLIQACAGLQEAHQEGVTHRDLKPENIMVRSDQSGIFDVRILDFGIAQLNENDAAEEESQTVGSPGYMSPEQITGDPVDHRTDLYSLGVIFYELIIGKPPFQGSSIKQTMMMHVRALHMPPSKAGNFEDHAWIDRIAERALAKDPAKRYQSANEMRDDLLIMLEPKTPGK